jgi:hypothetical protein
MTEGAGKCRARAAVTQQDKDAAKRDAQVKVWRAWRRERREALLAGPYSADAQALLDFLQTMRISSATELIKVVNCGPWCQIPPVNRKSRHCALPPDLLASLRWRRCPLQKMPANSMSLACPPVLPPRPKLQLCP